MHIDFTLHFWTLLSQCAALLGLGMFLYKTYAGISSVIAAILTIVREHHEMYGWYQGVKGRV